MWILVQANVKQSSFLTRLDFPPAFVSNVVGFWLFLFRSQSFWLFSTIAQFSSNKFIIFFTNDFSVNLTLARLHNLTVSFHIQSGTAKRFIVEEVPQAYPRCSLYLPLGRSAWLDLVFLSRSIVSAILRFLKDKDEPFPDQVSPCTIS